MLPASRATSVPGNSLQFTQTLRLGSPRSEILAIPYLSSPSLFCSFNIGPMNFQCIAHLRALSWPRIIGKETQGMQHVLKSLSQPLFLSLNYSSFLPGSLLTLGPKSFCILSIAACRNGQKKKKHHSFINFLQIILTAGKLQLDT